MKIVHALYGLDMGGMEFLVAQLARLQRAQGHDVHLFAYSRLGVLGEALKAEGFPVYVPGEAHPLVTMTRYLRRFLKMRPDVVHSHGLAPAIHASIPARIAGVPTVLSTRHRVEFFPYDRTAEIQYGLMGWFCDFVTGICEVTCDDLRKGPCAARHKIVRVYNGTEPITRVNFDALGKRAFTVLFVGRVVPEKSLETLLRAIALTPPGIDLWVVGAGRSRPPLEALSAELGIEGRVTFWGQQLDTAPFFSAADLFSMSSISEGLPISLLQSMSLGTPAVLTDVDGMGEVLRLTGGGLLVPPNDPEALAAAILRLAQDPQLRAELAQRALAAYQTHFTLERMAEAYMTLYTSSL